MQDGGLTVLFTKPDPTLAALRAARRLMPEDGPPVRLIVTLPVPYPLPLSKPPVPLGFTEQQVRRLATQAEVAAKVELCLCRDHREALHECLRPGSLVVLGGQRHWWRGGREQRLARWLQAHGHSVVLAAPEEEGNRSAVNH
jgi:hypothetical protein